MSERKEDKVGKEEAFLAPLEVESNRVKKWIEGGDKWGQGFEEGNRVDAKQERGTEKRKLGRGRESQEK